MSWQPPASRDDEASRVQGSTGSISVLGHEDVAPPPPRRHQFGFAAPGPPETPPHRRRRGPGLTRHRRAEAA